MPTPCRSCRPRVALARPRCLHGRHLAHARDVKSPSLPYSLHPLSPSPFPLPFSCSLSSRHHAARHGRPQPSFGLTALATVRCSSDPVITTISVDTPSSARLVASPSSSAIVRKLSSWPQPRPAVLMWPGHYGPPRAEPRLPTGACGPPDAPPPLPRRRRTFSGRNSKLRPSSALFFPTRDVAQEFE